MAPRGRWGLPLIEIIRIYQKRLHLLTNGANPNKYRTSLVVTLGHAAHCHSVLLIVTINCIVL